MADPEVRNSKPLQLSPEEVNALCERLTQEYESRGLFTKIFEDEPKRGTKTSPNSLVMLTSASTLTTDHT